MRRYLGLGLVMGMALGVVGCADEQMVSTSVRCLRAAAHAQAADDQVTVVRCGDETGPIIPAMPE